MEKEPKKRGRKPKQNKNISIQTNHDIKEEFIVKLDINNIKHDQIDAYIKGDIELELSNTIKQSELCWNCCHQFNDLVHGIPLKIKNGIFYTYGDFCSLECASRYAFEYFKDKEFLEIFSLINLYNYKLTKSFDTIKMGPSKLHLKCFGGNLTIEEYRESFIKQSILELQIQPIISISHTEELYEIKNNSNNEGLKLFRKNKKSSQKKNIKNVMDLEINKD
jgi:hypothetical protein